jgi:hypothetical protein
MRLKLLFITVALFVVCESSCGQLLQWNTFANGGTETTEPSVFNDANVSSADLTFGAGVTAAANGNRFGGNGWWNTGNTVAGNTITEAVTGNDYIQFVVTPNSGYSFTPTSFIFSWDRSTTGPNKVTLRSSVDGFTNDLGIVTGMTEAITLNTITITGHTNITTATTFRIYGYGATAAGGTGGFDIGSNVVNVELNGTTASIGPTSVTSGDWNTASTWSTGSVPITTDNVTISTAHIVYSSTALTRTGTTTVNGGFELRAGGWASGTNFTYGATGTLIFNQSSGGSYGVNNGDVFWPTTNSPFNVTNSGQGLTMNSMARTVTGTFQTSATVNFPTSTLILNGITKINADGFFNQSPIFGSTSTLIYNSGGFYGRGYEWSALGIGTIGTTPGYPNNIQLSGNTTLNYNNGTPLAKAINSNLSIDSGSNFYMDFDGGTSGGVLTVAGNVTNNGNFTLGNAVGDDLKLGGNFTNTGTFNGNNRAIFFTKAGTQIVTSLSGITIPYIVLSGGTTVQLATGTNMLISAPNEGNAISFTNSSDVFDINIGNTLTIGTATKANTIFGSGTFKGSTTSNLTLLGSGSVGTLNFTTGSQVLKNLTLDRQTSNIGFDLGTVVTIDGTLALTNGIANLSNQTMIITLGGQISGASSSNYIIADFTAGGVLRKNFPAGTNIAGNFTFPIGDRTSSAEGSQYSPATINFTAANYSSGYAALSVEDNKEPNNEASTDFITRYWKLTSSGITNATYNFTGTYLPADISGTETNCKSGRYSTSNSTWTDGTNLVSGANTISLTGLTSSTGALTSPNHFTGSYRNREINIKGLTGGTNNIASGSAAANGLNNTLFAETNLGSTATKDYEIQNLGITALNLTGTPIVNIGGANPGDFTVTTVPSTPIIGGSSTSFIITFSPTYTGIRTAIVSIANNDSDENLYTFLIQGTGVCTTTAINTLTPTSGPVGTEVTITAIANNLTGATVSFNGVAATSITYVSSTQIKVVVPSGATSGNIVVTNASGCTATNTFTVVNNLVTSCQGGSSSSDLFISEVTDATTGGLTYIEIYNGTGSTINLSNYALQTFSNGSSTTSSVVNLNNVNLTSGSIYVVALGISASPDVLDTCTLITGGNGELANQVSTNAGINFDNNGNDYIALYNTSTNIKADSFGTYENNTWASSLGIGDRGVVFRRKNTATLPSATYSNSDWDITNWTGSGSDSCSTNDYSNIGTYTFTVSTPPTVTLHPNYSPTCKSTIFTVSGTEGYNGTSPADTKELTYQWLVSAPNATAWTEITDGTNYSGSSTATLSIANISTIINYQYYCQIRENTNTCYTASNAVKIIDGTITWNGTDWRDVNNAIAIPSLSKLAVINSNYNTATNGDLNACSVIVNAGKVLTATAQKFVTIQNDLTINSTGTLEVLDKGSLVMINDSGIVTNNGTTNIQRKTTDFELYDYTYWSTPIVSTDIETTFTTLPSYPTDWRIDNAYEFIPANYMDVDNDGFDDNHDDWSFVTSMIPGKGYIIMVPERPSPFPPYTSATVIFSGKVNNGVVTTPIALTPDVVPAVADDDFNLVGNPYPSAISADAFINANLSTNGTAYNTLEGTLYFWTHKKDLSANNLGPDALNYSQDDYAVYTLAGGTGTSGTVAGAIEDTTNRPNGYIASGQGFFVEAVNPGTLLFNNSMRVGLPASANSQFYKSRPGKSKIKSKDRIWLNLENSLGMFSQQLVGYFDSTTLGYDNGYDGLLSDAGNYIDFYSFIDDKTYKIQGRAAYDENDQVRLGYFSAVAGTFNINIDSKEGVFANLITPVYLEDKLLNLIHDLKQSPYTFTTEKGTFNDRFILRYTNKTLGTNDLETTENQVVVSNKDKQIKVNSAVETIDKVLVYDLLGRQLFKKEKVNSNELSIPNLNSSHQTLFIKVILQNDQTVTRKIIY